MSGQAIVIIFALLFLRPTLGILSCPLEGSTVIDPIDTSKLTKIGDKYYLIEEHNNKLNWYGAAHYCRANGLNLANIENEKELYSLSDYLFSKGFGIDDLFWTSGNDLETEGTFKSLSTGKLMTYFKWINNHQPDNYLGNENCIELWLYTRENSADKTKFLMNDRDCAQVSRFICEAPMRKKVKYLVW